MLRDKCLLNGLLLLLLLRLVWVLLLITVLLMLLLRVSGVPLALLRVPILLILPIRLLRLSLLLLTTRDEWLLTTGAELECAGVEATTALLS